MDDLDGFFDRSDCKQSLHSLKRLCKRKRQVILPAAKPLSIAALDDDLLSDDDLISVSSTAPTTSAKHAKNSAADSDDNESVRSITPPPSNIISADLLLGLSQMKENLSQVRATYTTPQLIDLDPEITTHEWDSVFTTANTSTTTTTNTTNTTSAASTFHSTTSNPEVVLKVEFKSLHQISRKPIKFKIKANSTFEKIFTQLSEKLSLPPTQITLKFKSATIARNATPSSLGITAATNPETLECWNSIEYTLHISRQQKLLSESLAEEEEQAVVVVDKVLIKLNGPDNSTLKLKVARNSTVEKILKVFINDCLNGAVELSRCALVFDGDRLTLDQTLDAVGLEDEDCLDVVVK